MRFIEPKTPINSLFKTITREEALRASKYLPPEDGPTFNQYNPNSSFVKTRSPCYAKIDGAITERCQELLPKIDEAPKVKCCKIKKKLDDFSALINSSSKKQKELNTSIISKNLSLNKKGIGKLSRSIITATRSYNTQLTPGMFPRGSIESQEHSIDSILQSDEEECLSPTKSIISNTMTMNTESKFGKGTKNVTFD